MEALAAGDTFRRGHRILPGKSVRHASMNASLRRSNTGHWRCNFSGGTDSMGDMLSLAVCMYHTNTTLTASGTCGHQCGCLRLCKLNPVAHFLELIWIKCSFMSVNKG